ncbi:unnamed protein product [Lecanosticta acicola]|uniref:Unnamed protein product n=1 Tax=Lecanosticta acicola TaxID=111012 RepID=A0AAI8YPP8_9PEZI|nr:unnamed protein product [Lecanosticta acicola]
MRLSNSIAGLCLLTLASGAAARNATQQQSINNATALPLPLCGQRCYAQVLPTYDCNSGDASCICPNANLTTALSACSQSNCTVPEQLTFEKFSKDSCGAISRNHSSNTRVTTWTLFALALVFVGARFIARPERLKGSGYGSDDWTIASTLLVLLPLNVLVQAMTNNGLGADNYTLQASEITAFLKEFYIFEILYTLVVFLTKVSILQLYLRIWTVEAVSRWFRLAVWSLILLNLVTMLAFALSLVAQCSPISYAWHDWDLLHVGHCVNQQAQIYVLGAFNIAYDVVVFIFPLHNFLKLNISWQRKFGVCLIFMVGLLVTICSIVRLQYLVKIGVSGNPTWDYNSAVVWSSVECNISVVCTCMPAMAGLLQRLWAAMSGQPLTSSSGSESKAPMHPTVIDPENPVRDEEMLRMRDPNSMDECATEMAESDRGAPTEKVFRHKENAATSRGIEIKHEPPSETTATRMSYRDSEGRLHEVKVIDKPTEDVDPNFEGRSCHSG